ncbi:MAG: hypothetical protein KIC94_21100 [Clostridiales bacterium]|nr:hypothetical protein [Clostridiales bacterium]
MNRFEDYLLTKEGDFSMQAGQHTITYQAYDSLAEGQYYIYIIITTQIIQQQLNTIGLHM